MFWGRSLREGEVLSLTEECGTTAILHISHASLSPMEDKETTKVMLAAEGSNYTLAVMSKGKEDFKDIDLSFSCGNDCFVTVQGPGEVNLLGYFEAMGSIEAQEDSEDDSSDSSSDEEISFLPRSQRPLSPSSSENSSSP